MISAEALTRVSCAIDVWLYDAQQGTKLSRRVEVLEMLNKT